jgi:uncharacterized protein YbjQ (UPF0145 family)
LRTISGESKTLIPGEPHPALLLALHRLLRPLVRVLIAKGITFPALLRLLKEAYVEVAQEDFPVSGKRQTDSRINLLTGVHRKDIKALRERRRGGDAPSPVLSRNAYLIALWTGAPDYLDTRGRPRPLPRQSAKDDGPSFDSLVESVSTDIRPRAVLDEWVRQGLARVDDDEFIHLDMAAFVPNEEFADLAYYFGRNLRDHIAASSHNLLGDEPSMLERAVYYEELRPRSVEELAALSRELGSDVLVKVNQKAFELSEQDKGSPEASERISFGVYFYTGPDDSQDDSTEGEE